MMLQEEPDAAKLRKKFVDQQVEMANLRQVMKKIAKERDQYKARVKPNYRGGAAAAHPREPQRYHQGPAHRPDLAD